MRRTSPTDQLCQHPLISLQRNYLGLRVSFARLSPDGSICGVTAYADTEYKITELGITRTLALKRNQIILDESFIRSGNVQRLCAKRRFTLAHECAHQILFQLESEEVKASCEMRYSAQTAYTPRELKTREDWNEWQANVLGAAILLPQKEVDLAMRRFEETPLINYEGRHSYIAQRARHVLTFWTWKINEFSFALGCSAAR